MKPTIFAIAVVIQNPVNPLEVLAVKRPPTDAALSNVWGLPAIIVENGELPEDAVRRLGIEKLSTDIEPASYVGIARSEKEEHELILMEIEAKLKGPAPSVESATTTGTKYVDQQWTSDYSIFKDAASKGSLCTKIFLESKEIS